MLNLKFILGKNVQWESPSYGFHVHYCAKVVYFVGYHIFPSSPVLNVRALRVSNFKVCGGNRLDAVTSSYRRVPFTYLRTPGGTRRTEVGMTSGMEGRGG
jgi:hypothetical protein